MNPLILCHENDLNGSTFSIILGVSKLCPLFYLRHHKKSWFRLFSITIPTSPIYTWGCLWETKQLRGKCIKLLILLGQRCHCWLTLWRRFKYLIMEYRLMIKQSQWTNRFIRAPHLPALASNSGSQKISESLLWPTLFKTMVVIFLVDDSWSHGACWRWSVLITPLLLYRSWIFQKI